MTLVSFLKRSQEYVWKNKNDIRVIKNGDRNEEDKSGRLVRKIQDI